MSGWYEHFHFSTDPFNEDSPSWNFFYGGCYGIASLKLEQALERKRGLILVTGPPGSGKSALVRNALGRMRLCASATVSAAQTGPTAVIDILLRSREPVEGGFSATRKRAALIAMIEQARASGRPIVCVIEDAHLARAGQIKDLIAAIDTAPDAPRAFQVVLVGRAGLLDTMRGRALGDLRTRTTATIELTPLKPAEVSEFLTERLEAAEAAVPDVVLPPIAMTAIAHHSHGLIGLAGALARTSLERAAETGSDTVTVELIDEVAPLYGTLPLDAQPKTHKTARAFGLGAIAALVLLALVVAAAEVRLLGSGGRRVRADLDALRSLAGFGPGGESASNHSLDSAGGASRATAATGTAGTADSDDRQLSEDQRLAEVGTPRDEFLGPGSPRATDSNSAETGAYEVQIKPPQRPSANTVTGASGPASAGETVITVPGIPGPLRPREGAETTDRVIRSSEITIPGGAPALPGSKEPLPVGSVPLPPESDSEKASAARTETIVINPTSPGPMTPPATDSSAGRRAATTPMTGPSFSLQVGAFREQSSAEVLRAKLAQQFTDVFVSPTSSGGEPLYRVRVGRFPTADLSNGTREKLQAAGHASFRVTEP